MSTYRVVDTLYTRGANCFQPRKNPNVPKKRGFRVPFTFEICRYVVLYRLLAFDVASIAGVCGITIKQVKHILQIFGGHMPRRRKGLGSIIWDKGYAVTEKVHKGLGLPAIIPLSVDNACIGPEVLADFDLITMKLPEPEWTPERGGCRDGYSDWARKLWPDR